MDIKKNNYAVVGDISCYFSIYDSHHYKRHYALGGSLYERDQSKGGA